jgi:hypothetical protein
MISKDSYSNLYLGIYQAEIKKEGAERTVRPVGWTIRLYLADRPPVRRGPSAWFEGDWGSTGGSGANNGPSAPGCRTVRAPRGLSAGASWNIRAYRTQVGPRSQGDKSTTLPFFFPNRKSPSPHLSLSLSLSLSLLLFLKEGPPSWGFRMGHSPDRPSTSPDSL